MSEESPTVETSDPIPSGESISTPKEETSTTPKEETSTTLVESSATDRPSVDSPTVEKKSIPTSSSTAAFTKIEITIKAVGDAPILKQQKWTVPLSKTVGWVSGNIRKYLKMDANESLFLYVRQSFAPSPDQTIENIYDCFGSGDGKLILHYSKTQAWG